MIRKIRLRTLFPAVTDVLAGVLNRRSLAGFAAAGIVATTLVVVGQADESAFAAPADRVTASWNMQGQRQGGGRPQEGPPESRWRTALNRMLNDEGVQVAALQEAGSAPLTPTT